MAQATTDPTKKYYIGYYRKDSSSPYKWENGNPVSYINWKDGEPDGDGDCAVFQADVDGWFDEDCDQSYPMFCRKLAPVVITQAVTIPTTITTTSTTTIQPTTDHTTKKITTAQTTEINPTTTNSLNPLTSRLATTDSVTSKTIESTSSEGGLTIGVGATTRATTQSIEVLTSTTQPNAATVVNTMGVEVSSTPPGAATVTNTGSIGIATSMAQPSAIYVENTGNIGVATSMDKSGAITEKHTGSIGVATSMAQPGAITVEHTGNIGVATFMNQSGAITEKHTGSIGLATSMDQPGPGAITVKNTMNIEVASSKTQINSATVENALSVEVAIFTTPPSVATVDGANGFDSTSNNLLFKTSSASSKIYILASTVSATDNNIGNPSTMTANYGNVTVPTLKSAVSASGLASEINSLSTTQKSSETIIKSTNTVKSSSEIFEMSLKSISEQPMQSSDLTPETYTSNLKADIGVNGSDISIDAANPTSLTDKSVSNSGSTTSLKSGFNSSSFSDPHSVITGSVNAYDKFPFSKTMKTESQETFETEIEVTSDIIHEVSINANSVSMTNSPQGSRVSQSALTQSIRLYETQENTGTPYTLLNTKVEINPLLNTTEIASSHTQVPTFQGQLSCCCRCCVTFSSNQLSDCGSCSRDNLSDASTCATDRITKTSLVSTTTPNPIDSESNFKPSPLPDSRYERLGYTESFAKMQEFTEYFARLPQDIQEALGFHLSNMLLDCTYNGEKCDMGNFEHFINPVHGNCYAFNSGWNKSRTLLQSTAPGRQFGLRMVLNIDQDDYVNEVGDTAGLRVVVLDQKQIALPEGYGITISPGHYTAVSVEKISTDKDQSLYGECIKPEVNDTLRNLYSVRYPVEYTAESCQKTCKQRHTISLCGCADANLPAGPEYGLGDINICSTSNITQDDCIYEVTQKFTWNILHCDCPSRCRDVIYTLTPSIAAWPPKSNEFQILRELQNIVPPSMNVFDKQTLEENLIKLDIFFSKFEYKYYWETPSYTVIQYFTDLSAIVGLFFGMALMTILEFVEYIIDVIVLTASRVLHKIK